MSSLKQIAANQANARKSTGPRTEDGKSRSCLNAVRDNLTGQITALSAEDRPIFEKLKAEYVADLAPKSLTELKLAHAIAWDTWRLDRLRATEMNIYAQGIHDIAEPGTQPDDFNSAMADAETYRREAHYFELMSVYEQRMNRSLHRNRAALRELQAERARLCEQDRQAEILIARAHEMKDLPYEATKTPSPNGFVFSTSEITAAAERQRTLEAADYFLNRRQPASEASAPLDPLESKPHHHGLYPESIDLRSLYHHDC